MRGLKWNDVPKPNTGLERCFNFADAMCRAAVGGHYYNAAGVSLDNFIRDAQNLQQDGQLCRVRGGPAQRAPGQRDGALAAPSPHRCPAACAWRAHRESPGRSPPDPTCPESEHLGSLWAAG
jgi:hypothetical protein